MCLYVPLIRHINHLSLLDETLRFYVDHSDNEPSPWLGRMEQRQHRAASPDSVRSAGGCRWVGALDRRFPHRGGYLQHYAGRLARPSEHGNFFLPKANGLLSHRHIFLAGVFGE